MSETDIKGQLTTAELLTSFQSRMLKTGKDKRTTSWLKTNLEEVTS